MDTGRAAYIVEIKIRWRERILNNTVPDDEEWQMLEDGDFVRLEK